MKINYTQENKIKRVSFIITRKPLGTMLNIVWFLFYSFMFIFGWTKYPTGILIIPFVILLLLSIVFILPYKKVIESNKNLKRVIIKHYIGKICIGYKSYPVREQKLIWVYEEGVKEFSALNNLPNQEEAKKISKFLGLNSDSEVAYL